ncbi:MULTISPECIES: helicase-related protein [unclassified Microcoleus]|uniref:helicase-related protein n=1 Tax=unclassified Microcoleus TaxID=2642155 RepID=UPI002FD0A25B
MPRIFDNMQKKLLPELRDTLDVAIRADFCVGYVNLRGWRSIEDKIEKFAGTENARCRLLVGMQTLPKDELQNLLSLSSEEDRISLSEVSKIKRRYVEEFRSQLTLGAPNNQDEAALRRLSAQLKAGKVTVKLFARHTLHAKLYLVYVPEKTPRIAFLGSSNLTLSGLSKQGELNIDVNDHVATETLEEWFEHKWTDRFCVDISQELGEIIDESWAKEELTPPYHIYLKMVYHLSQEARAGINEYRLPKEFKLFDFQAAAVKIAARHVNRRGGVMIADVVGLGKTMIATALARVLQDDSFLETLIICPKNLVAMWEDYVSKYRVIAKVMSISRVQDELKDLRRYRVVLIDESHNLRNREGKRYRAIQQYIETNESKCILLTATPYNKTYLDLSSQFQLFIAEDRNLGIRPEKYIDALGGELEFRKKHQADVRSLKAFDFSQEPDDWRDLMKLFMVRRTRSFIKNNYALTDESGRKYLEFPNGEKSYFPNRIPKTAKFSINNAKDDPYSMLYSERVVDVINTLNLPRYGLGNFAIHKPVKPPTEPERKILDSLSRAGKRLMGFCRINLFKRLESSGSAFLLSIDRHILRNYIFLYAIANDLNIPIGTQNAELLDTKNVDEDSDSLLSTDSDVESEGDSTDTDVEDNAKGDYEKRAKLVYELYAKKYKKRFKWIRSDLFKKGLKNALLSDAQALIQVISLCPGWQASKDRKLETLVKLLTVDHSDRKVLIFTQFADTANYLGEQLTKFGVDKLATVTGSTENPTELAYQFSPKSNSRLGVVVSELRVLIATDVLSEGQNLQDCDIIVNYDLPWAIIRLIQRAGRIDRIGQDSEQILCYSFLPADGVEDLIKLRSRLRKRLEENAEVVGTDESFFEDDEARVVRDLYNEKSGIYDESDDDNEVDLISEAFQIWKNATDKNPKLKKIIESLPNVSYSTRSHSPEPTKPEGVMIYVRTAEGNDALAYVGHNGESVTQSQLAILRLAACEPDTPAIPRDEKHHALVASGTKMLVKEEKDTGGSLGSSKSARFRAYERLKRYVEHEQVKNPLLVLPDLPKAVEEIYRYPLRQSAIDTLNRKFKDGIDDEQLANLVLDIRKDDCLCIISEDARHHEPQIICSLGLYKG